jgi:hypothetical protein
VAIHYLQRKRGLDPLTLFSSLKFSKWGTKTGFILINNAKFIQIDNQEEKNNFEIQNLKLLTADSLPLSTPSKKLRFE